MGHRQTSYSADSHHARVCQEAEKVLLDNGHRFIRGEHPLNYALRNNFVHFVSCRWTKRYTDEVWYSVDPWRSSTTEIGFGPVADFTQALFAQTALVRLLSVPIFLMVTVVSAALLPVLYLIQIVSRTIEMDMTVTSGQHRQLLGQSLNS